MHASSPMEQLTWALYDAAAMFLSRRLEPTFGSYVSASGEVGPFFPDPDAGAPATALSAEALRKRIKATAPGDAVAFGVVTSVIAIDERGATRRFLELVLEYHTGGGGQVIAEYTFDDAGCVRLVGEPVLHAELPKARATH